MAHLGVGLIQCAEEGCGDRRWISCEGLAGENMLGFGRHHSTEHSRIMEGTTFFNRGFLKDFDGMFLRKCHICCMHSQSVMPLSTFDEKAYVNGLHFKVRMDF